MGIDPTFQQLRVFREVARELHFGRAAAKLQMSQPPVTRHVKALEACIGVPLLKRTSRRVDLTQAGAKLLLEADIIVERLDHAVEEATRAANGLVGSLALGYVEPLAYGVLTEVLSQFLLLHPSIAVNTYQLDSGEQLERLLQGQLDCALIRSPSDVEVNLEFTTACVDEFVVALPANHRLVRAGLKDVDVGELEHERFITYEGTIGQGMIAAMLSGCASAGFTPKIGHQVQNTMVLLARVANGDGVALVSGALRRCPRPSVVFLPLVGTPARSSIMFAVRRGEGTNAIADLLHLFKLSGPV